MENDLGSRIKNRRNKLNITMDELAARVGYTAPARKTTIYNFEVGRNEISISRLPSFATALETNLYYLLGLTDIDYLTDDDILRLIKEDHENKNSPNATPVDNTQS